MHCQYPSLEATVSRERFRHARRQQMVWIAILAYKPVSDRSIAIDIVSPFQSLGKD